MSMIKTNACSKTTKIDWYHTFDFGDEVVRGRYDWRPYFNQFELGNLRKKTVLDVGAGDGFFSFEFEKKGGQSYGD